MVATTYAQPNASATPAQPPPKPQLPGQDSPYQQQAAASLNIVFHRRHAHSRQFINLQELLERCSRWDWAAAAAAGQGNATQPGAGGASQLLLNCSAHVFGDVRASVQAAQAADVFIGTHGANLANGEPTARMDSTAVPGAVPTSAGCALVQASSCGRAAPWWR